MGTHRMKNSMLYSIPFLPEKLHHLQFTGLVSHSQLLRSWAIYNCKCRKFFNKNTFISRRLRQSKTSPTLETFVTHVHQEKYSSPSLRKKVVPMFGNAPPPPPHFWLPCIIESDRQPFFFFLLLPRARLFSDAGRGMFHIRQIGSTCERPLPPPSMLIHGNAGLFSPLHLTACVLNMRDSTGGGEKKNKRAK